MEIYALLLRNIQNNMQAKNLSFEEIMVGEIASFERTWSTDDIEMFSKVSGDTNPLHMDIGYAETTQFKERLVHGMLTASLFSTLVGIYLPGKKKFIFKSDTCF